MKGFLIVLSTTAGGVGEESLVTVHFKYNSYKDRAEEGKGSKEKGYYQGGQRQQLGRNQ